MRELEEELKKKEDKSKALENKLKGEKTNSTQLTEENEKHAEDLKKLQTEVKTIKKWRKSGIKRRGKGVTINY